MKPNYSFKAKVMESGLCTKERQISKAVYSHDCLMLYGEIVPCKLDYETAIKERSLLLQECPEEYNEAKKINHAQFKRKIRIQKRITPWLTEDKKCLFLTLTFTDKTLSKTSPVTRRKYVDRFLKQFNAPFVANKDFGKKNHREHYHAVIRCDYIDFTLWHKYGAIKSETIHRPNSSARLSKYIAKLTNHAIKETTKRSVILYSR